MGNLRPAIPRFTAATLLALLAPAEAGEKVALRVADGRFLRAAQDGTIRADRLIPGEEESFEWIGDEGGPVALKSHNGRFVTAAGAMGTRLRADGPPAEPGDRETFTLLRAGGNRVGMKARGSDHLVRFANSDARVPNHEPGAEPGPDQTVEVFRVSELPAFVSGGLGLAIQSLLIKELEGEQYDKTRTRTRREYVELPAPTLRDPGRTKRHRLWSVTEEYRIQARLDGTPDVRVARVPCLRGHFEPGADLLMFDVRASVPVSGNVRYKIPDALSASTGYRAVVSLCAAGEIRTEHSGDGLSVNPPRLLDLGVEMHRLDLSNDVLHLVRRGIEDLANHELRSRRAEIRDKANKALAKAIEDARFRPSLLSFLTRPAAAGKVGSGQ